MLKENIETLNNVENEVISTTQVLETMKNKFKSLKKDLKKLLWEHQITQEVYNENLYRLKIAYKTSREDLELNFDKEVTYFVNKYEDFNNFKVQNDVSLEKKELLTPVIEQIYDLKFSISQETDKVKKQTLKKQLTSLKAQKSDIKTSYSKTMKNKTYLMISLIAMIILMAVTIVLTFVVIWPKRNITDGAYVIPLVVIISLSMVLMSIYLGYLIKNETKKWALDRNTPTISVFLHSIWIFFLDSFGLGAFAVITSIFKANGIFKDDKKIPGTLNVTRVVASFFLGSLVLVAVDIDIWTMIILLVMVMIGSFAGTTIVSKIKRKPLALTMGIILAICSVLMLLSMNRIGVIPAGTKKGLLGEGDWYLMLIGAILFIGIGMLQAFGIGIYAPCMILVVLLGMDFSFAPPLMMLSAALSAQVNAYTGMRKNNHLPRTSWTMIFGSVVGCFLYFMIIWLGMITFGGVDKKYVTEALQWISIPIIGYSAYLLLKSYWNLRKIDFGKRIKKIHLQLTDLDTINYSIIFKNTLESINRTEIDYNKKNLELKYQYTHWI